MSPNTFSSQSLPVTFINGFSAQPLCTAVLPTLPRAGDHFNLGTLAYQVIGCDWTLATDGRLTIQVSLLPAVNADGERPFSYAEEKQLPTRWPAPPADRGQE